jgi:hypothetical protein
MPGIHAARVPGIPASMPAPEAAKSPSRKPAPERCRFLGRGKGKSK